MKGSNRGIEFSLSKKHISTICFFLFNNGKHFIFGFWIENNSITDLSIESTKRVGIDYAGEDALLPWRYILKDFR